jgi:hypothetical protein
MIAKYWQAAWSAYIPFRRLHKRIPELISQYPKSAQRICLHQRQGLDRSDEQMATHILKHIYWI